eukprot:TRINITY_DN19070_c0_g1_i4.p1 TRINITY_DN19070_c0_g1~~TRINITY_DN19070_c0_g1_i4.p1  ORF type:complete len:310 (+),score=41.53 TRINITY_DN19070_c0_g1_i4:38-967(+)
MIKLPRGVGQRLPHGLNQTVFCPDAGATASAGLGGSGRALGGGTGILVFAAERRPLYVQEGTPCVLDEDCVCADSSLVRELVNVTLDGTGCYACEVQRPPACTEAPDQCTPEACECANSQTHSKHSTATVDGIHCHYCEPIAGLSGGIGMPEFMIVAMVAVVFLVYHILTRKPPAGSLGRGSRNGLRLARRQGDRSSAIRVKQEPLSWPDEVLNLVADTLDALLDWLYEIICGVWYAISSFCSLLWSATLWILRGTEQLLLGIADCLTWSSVSSCCGLCRGRRCEVLVPHSRAGAADVIGSKTTKAGRA